MTCLGTGPMKVCHELGTEPEAVAAAAQSGAAAHVAALTKELSELASELLPADAPGGAAAGRRGAAAADAAPLRQRLADSWQGKVQCPSSPHGRSLCQGLRS